ncbi:PGDYG domain-containing protein [Streptosporangium sp. NPDC048047]|uniref:PGDYG domain-containing protein n=1 Tax=Streptosporangium sp. NPDC048047 TaxID=3155748 RepID=UPI00341D95E8
MTALLAAPAVQFGFGLLGISPPPPFPAAFDEHIDSWDRAVARLRTLTTDAEQVLWRMTSRNEGPAVSACAARLTADDGPLRGGERMAADCHATALALRIVKIASTATWTAIALFAAAVGVAVGAALLLGAGVSLPATLARALAMIGKVLRNLRAAFQRLFRSLLERIAGRRYVDMNGKAMTHRFADAPVYRKKAVVRVRNAREGEEVSTVLADGTKETVNRAAAGDRIITNPRGEEYIVTPENYAKRYDDIGGGEARAKGMVRAFQNPTGRHVSIDAPWGERMRGGPDVQFAMAVDPKDVRALTSDRYLIGAKEFAADYEPMPLL